MVLFLIREEAMLIVMGLTKYGITKKGNFNIKFPKKENLMDYISRSCD